MSEESFSPEFVPKSNWFKFEEVGNTIKGTLVGMFEKPGDGAMPDQIVYELNNVEINGEKEAPEKEWKVPIKRANKFIIDRLKYAKLGQRIGFQFSGTVPAKKPGMNPAKSITPYLWEMDPTYTAKEVFGGVEVEDVPFK